MRSPIGSGYAATPHDVVTMYGELRHIHVLPRSTPGCARYLEAGGKQRPRQPHGELLAADPCHEVAVANRRLSR